MFNSILVVCVGNICRSPTGERLLKNYLPTKDISSAGLSAVVGDPANRMSREVAEANGLSLEGHIARQVTPELCRSNDVILVMERRHINAICALCPEARGKTFLLGHWLDQKEIPDPHRKSKEAFDFVYELINKSAISWSKALNDN
ncbi:protein tyrosine phosphatase [Serratia fonticola]|uniref:arsenate reductase/protein-tyrosine-phosphatase family protein n=1 Tax=Serratia fonticola TaxID=47917 RepID=UPI001AEA5E5A|nr:protein tyrosine phosphatase [Serratia fonticola]MBP0995455.1 protein tyrosine phosphatase [Serratia fonticola]MBP1001127.1 protein tyrosine phosphatase [Serratia fonticola]MBP1010275.1 protein tyrosine phosphatase [Serratia fonticola]